MTVALVEGDDVETGNPHERLLKEEMLRAEIARLKAMTALFEDMGALFKGMASQAEAEADVAICKKEEVERDSKDVDLKELLASKRKSEIELEIARNRDQVKRIQERTEQHRRGQPPKSPYRKDPKTSVHADKKEVLVDTQSSASLKGPIRGLDKVPTTASP